MESDMIKYNKLKAFTLAEIMILLLTLSILLAAFAPVFTRRYSNAGADEVWTYVFNDDNFDAYYDVTNDNYTAQAFFGLTPKDKYQVQKFSSDESNNVFPSKVVIAASKSLSGNRGLQRQMGFRFGPNTGTPVGYLFANNKNILVGGNYESIGNLTTANTSFGYMSLNELGNSTIGNGNTAVGAYALSKLKNTGYNTAIGAFPSTAGNIGYGNTLIGYYAAANANSVNFAYNTAIGYQSMGNKNGSSTYNTAIGHGSLSGDGDGNYNVAVGQYALNDFESGIGNTAVGAYSMAWFTNGSYNTAIGYNSCSYNYKHSYTTCIGSNQYLPDYLKNKNSKDDEVVLIGKTTIGGGILEVHNRPTKNLNSAPIPNAGNETVVVNGNLIVRGATYLEVPLARPSNYYENNSHNYAKIFTIVSAMFLGDNWSNTQTRDYYKNVPKGLVAFTLNRNNNNKVAKDYYAFSGYDGARRDGRNNGRCGGKCRRHEYEQIRTNAICTMVNGNGTTFTTNMVSDTSFYKGKGEVSTSYDWFTKTNNSNYIGATNCGDEESTDKGNGASYYTDLSTNANVYLERFHPSNLNGKNGSGNTRGPGVDKPLAHLKGYNSPCPNLSSDRRLKNVGAKYTAGLDEIRKLHIYNYTFKNDPNKLPQVGVIAQELKLIFPNAVTKGEDGYYKIRWDEMFYAAINSIKTLNAKIEKIASRVANDRNRIAVLKKDNAELNAKLDKLADELTQLEAQKRK